MASYEQLRSRHQETAAALLREVLERVDCPAERLGAFHDKELRAAGGGGGLEVATGLAGLKAFLRSLPDWKHRDDLGSLARYASNCIEKFGTGGGNFRAMYAEFLRHARQLVPKLVAEDAPGLAACSSAVWARLSGHLAELAEGPAEPASTHAVQALSQIVELETQLFESLAETTGAA